jgi:hypothetical protein
MTTSNKNRSNALVTHRRDFLKLALVTSGALATSRIVSDAGATASERRPEPTAPQQQGYHVTSHIKNYYDKARF